MDIKSNCSDPRAARLSNFTERRFVFDDMVCKSLEGFLQSLKIKDMRAQADVCYLSGKDAKIRGKDENKWKTSGVLWKAFR